MSLVNKFEKTLMLPGDPMAWDVKVISTALLKAFALLQKGEGGAYYAIIEILSLKRKAEKVPWEDEPLGRWVQAMSAVVSSLTPSVAHLVHQVIGLEWLDRSDAFIDKFRHFIENLVSANSSFLEPVFKMLVGRFREDVTQATQAELSTRFDNLHISISRVLSLIPSGPSIMVPILAKNFPQKDEDVAEFTSYIKNLLRITEYAPVLRDSVWSLCVDRAIQIDLEIQTELDELDEDEFAEVNKACFEDDDEELKRTRRNKAGGDADDPQFAFDSDDDDIDLDDETPDPKAKVLRFKRMADRLDNILCTLIKGVEEAYARAENEKSEKRQAAAADVSQMLLQIFDKTVLPTHRSRYTQFVWFLACFRDTGFCEAFIVHLARRTFDPAFPAILRMSASAYLGSFIARAKSLDPESVVHCVKMLNGWALDYVVNYEQDVRSPDIQKHGVFYSVVQALLYLFCFRWKQILADSYGQLPVEMTGFQRVLLSKFAPLKVCSKSVVTEFARITHKLDVMYCYSLMKQNESANGKQAAKRKKDMLDVPRSDTKSVNGRPPRAPKDGATAMSLTPSSFTPMSATPTTIGTLTPPAMAAMGGMARIQANGVYAATTSTNGAGSMAAGGPGPKSVVVSVRVSPPPIGPGEIKGPGAGAELASAAKAAIAPEKGDDALFRTAECLESFFPFDPCLIKETGKKLQPFYVTWDGGDDDEDGSSDSDEDEEEEEEEEADSDDEEGGRTLILHASFDLLMLAIFDFDRQFVGYAAFHNNKINQMIHMVFVPTILWTAMVWISNVPDFATWAYSDYLPLNATLVLATIFSSYYIALNTVIGGLMTPVLLFFVYTSKAFLTTESEINPNVVAGVIHIVSWIMQFLGHGIAEKRRPALMDNLIHALVLAPFFVFTELIFSLGYNPSLAKHLQAITDKKVAELNAVKRD
ncbi:hypothetical protein HK101_010189 [Irineochytrium annulatum]|nr:hypothetical protein HK101_010189 [Irineochytrium annulatum]